MKLKDCKNKNQIYDQIYTNIFNKIRNNIGFLMDSNLRFQINSPSVWYQFIPLIGPLIGPLIEQEYPLYLKKKYIKNS